MKTNDRIMGIHEAAAYLGRKHQSLRYMIQNGVLPAVMDGNAYAIRQSDLDKIKKQEFPEGMTHSDIAQVYAVKRTLVIHHFKRLRVKPLGFRRGRNNATVYDASTVASFAAILGWDRRQKSQTDG